MLFKKNFFPTKMKNIYKNYFFSIISYKKLNVLNSSLKLTIEQARTIWIYSGLFLSSQIILNVATIELKSVEFFKGTNVWHWFLRKSHLFASSCLIIIGGRVEIFPFNVHNQSGSADPTIFTNEKFP